MAGPSHSVPQEDFKAHQELLKRVTSNLGLEVEKLKEPTDTLSDILAAASPLKVALPIHEGVLKLVKALWQTPSSLPPISKGTERKNYVPAKGFDYLYSHPSPGSLVVTAANERDRLGQTSSTPQKRRQRG